MKLDDIPSLKWQIYWFVAVVKTLTGFEVWSQHRSKGTKSTRTMANSMLNSKIRIIVTWRLTQRSQIISR